MKPKILITLATGKTGYQSSIQLLQEGYPVKIYKQLTGQEPEDFETITRQYFDSSPFK